MCFDQVRKALQGVTLGVAASFRASTSVLVDKLVPLCEKSMLL